MKISIIIPIYNTLPLFLDNCISSCVGENFEIILIDDGSSINYSHLLAKYSDKVTYIKTENKGVSYARNLGLQRATGDYIFFVDADDIAVSSGIKTMREKAQNYNSDIVLSRIFIWDRDDIKLNKSSYMFSFELDKKRELIESVLLLDKNFTCVDTVWAKLYKKSFLEKNNIQFNTKLRNCEDVMFNYECYNKTDKIYYYNNVSYLYRVNMNSICHQYLADLDDRFLLFLKELNDFINDNNIEEPLYKDHVFRVVCRLFRKYYHYIPSFDEFYNKIVKLYNEDFVVDSLKNIDISTLNEDKCLLIDEFNHKNIDGLYEISKKARILKLK